MERQCSPVQAPIAHSPERLLRRSLRGHASRVVALRGRRLCLDSTSARRPCRVRDAVTQLVEAECVAVADAPGGQCAQGGAFLDARCAAAVLPRFSPAPVVNVTAADLAPVALAFTALQRACWQQQTGARMHLLA